MHAHIDLSSVCAVSTTDGALAIALMRGMPVVLILGSCSPTVPGRLVSSAFDLPSIVEELLACSPTGMIWIGRPKPVG